MISQEARSEGGQHEQGGLSEGAQHVQVVVSVGEQHDQQSSECMMRPVDGASESDEKPNGDMSVAGLTTVFTVEQNEARLPVFANLMPTPGQTKRTCQTNVEKSSATPGEASRPDTSVTKIVGYKTKFKSLYRIDGLSKGKFKLKNAKGVRCPTNFLLGNTTHSFTDSKMFSDRENKVKNIAHMFGGVKGEKKAQRSAGGVTSDNWGSID